MIPMSPLSISSNAQSARRGCFTVLACTALLLALGAGRAHAQNEIVLENQLAGNPPSEWDVSGAGDFSIQGYATEISVDQGQAIDFKIKTDATSYRIDIYRLGWYGGDGARFIDTVLPSVTLPQSQPTCLTAAEGDLVDCGNWAVSASWAVPATAVSGIYIAKLIRTDPEDGRSSHIVFVVRDDDGNSDLLFQTSDTTWQAYNRWGETGAVDGYSLYEGPTGKAEKVSYNRPFGTRQYPTEDWVFNAEYPMVRWLERNGYDVSYFTNVDTDRLGAEVLEHDVFLSVGHDEYWSRAMRENVTAARDAGVHLAFFSGNEIYWKVRWEDSLDVAGGSSRTLVCYKEGDLGENQCNTKCDPVADVWTGLWRSGCDYTPPADGCEPENSLSGQISWVGTTGSIQVPAEYGHLPIWRNTSIATLGPGQTATFPSGTLGYEWNQQQYEENYPANRLRLSKTQFSGETHHLSLYQAASGALVFGAGTVQWSWGLDDTHDRGSSPPDARMQQATVNLLADMNAEAQTLQTGLVAPTPLSDTVAPVSVIDSPTAGASLEAGTPTTIAGTATDSGAAGTALVEVSTDGGATWSPANGLDTWAFTWTPTVTGNHTLLSRARDAAFNVETPGAGVTVDVIPRECPCTFWSDSTMPAVASANDAQPVELGMKFSVEQDGFITAVRFYKGPSNGGIHTGHLWATDGTLLGSTTFTGETATGWQEQILDAPVPVAANTTYIVSYHAPTGGYALDEGLISPDGLDNPPMHAPADQTGDPNGVYKYGPAGSFPTDGFNASIYWVDLRFSTSATDTSPPQISARVPVPGSIDVDVNVKVSITFSEAIDDAALSFELRDDLGALVPATLSYDAGTRTAILDPAGSLVTSALHEVTVDGIVDLSGNARPGPETWSFTTEDPLPPPPDEGPGGPILVIGDAADPFSRYPAEILRAEGFNAFTVTDISLVDSAVLDAHDVVILGSMALSASQVTLLTNWVDAGGSLVALRPDAQLAGLLGLSLAGGTLAEGYLLVDTAVPPGQGIVGDTMQFHGTADLYDLAGAIAVASLYSDASTATTHPAVTLHEVGTNGGQALTFTYDLARSVVYTRQGNPAWEGQERDGTPPIRSDDLFYGNAAGDPQPDWVDLDKVAIPQADEQQRLLANAIQMMSADRLPLPRFWYFPSGHRAVVVMTGDEHGTGGGSVGRFDIYLAADPPGCSVADWECVRASGYIYPGAGMTDAQAAYYHAQGFEIGAHVNTGCDDWTPASLEADHISDLASLDAQLPSLPRQDSERTHCVVWSDWVTQAKVKFDLGIRLDTNYYFWPPAWVADRPGLFTGSGMPMRFADLDGTLIDVYQVVTQMTDESGQSYPFTIDTLLDRALGPEGYFGAFGANMHHDTVNHAEANAIVASAQARGVPIVSGRQMLTWLDARNSSSFSNLQWQSQTLSFDLARAGSALNLEAMVPVWVEGAQLTALDRDLAPISYRTETIKGVEYAIFEGLNGSYQASYVADTTPAVITNLGATANGDGTATITWDTDEATDSSVDYGTDAGSLSTSESDPSLVSSHSLVISGLSPDTTYYFRVSSTDAAANTATEPAPPDGPSSFTTPPAPCLVHTTTADFEAGTPGADTHVATVGDGEIVLRPTEVGEFEDASLPAGWTSNLYDPSGSITVAGGALSPDAGWAGPATLGPAGRVVEFEAAFTASGKQHVGFGETLNENYWAIFSTGTAGGTLYARTNGSGTAADVSLGSAFLGANHLYRIEWDPTELRFYVDGGLVHTEAVSITQNMRAIVSDGELGGAALSVRWLREIPYASSGSFLSSVFDSGGLSAWDAMTWVSDLPSGTGLDVLVRTGNTSLPDGSWTTFNSVVSSGDLVGGTSRYLQYRLDLSTTDTNRTPSVEEVRVACSLGEDTFPPVISNLQIIPAADGISATVTWTTDEASDSRVDYGTAPGTLDQVATEATLVTSHSIDLTGLTPGSIYWLRVTSADAEANAATFPEPPSTPATFETPAPPCAVVSTAAEFGTGSLAGAVTTEEIGDGAVILEPTEASDFGGTALPAGWSSSAWSTGGGATVSGGEVTVSAALVGPTTLYSAGRSVEFVATFGAESYQHGGFADDFDQNPWWAIFSTNNQTTNLYARTYPGGSDHNLGAGLLGNPHRYRVDWLTDRVDFWIDGTLVYSEPVSLVNPMRPIISDLNTNATDVVVQWLRMTPYAASGTWESAIFDAGADQSTWREMSWAQDTPAAASVTMSVRTGAVAVPDGTWSAWTTVATSGTDLQVDARYVQARALFETTDPTVTPALLDLGITCTACTDASPPPSISDLTAAQTTDGNPPGDRTSIELSWTLAEPGATVEVYRHAFGDYPEYDDAAGAEPSVPGDPAAALSAGWVPVYGGSESVFTDLPPVRDFWYYVAFVTDECGNVSATSNRTAGTLDYHLADVHDGTTDGSGDNKVDSADIAFLGAHYATAVGEGLYEPLLDVGPTSTQGTEGRPLTDNLIEFEDLILFAINYEDVSKGSGLARTSAPEPAERNLLSWVAPRELPPPGETVEVVLWAEADGRMQGLSAKLDWDRTVLELESAHSGALLAQQVAPHAFFTPEPGAIDLALLGHGRGMAGRGELARLVFRVEGEGSGEFSVGALVARDVENEKLELVAELHLDQPVPSGLPARTALHANVPNPFNPSTEIRFDLAGPGPVSLTIYAINGRKVVTLVDGTRPAGRYEVTWNGTDATGSRVASGTYLVRLSTREGDRTHRMALIK